MYSAVSLRATNVRRQTSSKVFPGDSSMWHLGHASAETFSTPPHKQTKTKTKHICVQERTVRYHHHHQKKDVFRAPRAVVVGQVSCAKSPQEETTAHKETATQSVRTKKSVSHTTDERVLRSLCTASSAGGPLQVSSPPLGVAGVAGRWNMTLPARPAVRLSAPCTFPLLAHTACRALDF